MRACPPLPERIASLHCGDNGGQYCAIAAKSSASRSHAFSRNAAEPSAADCGGPRFFPKTDPLLTAGETVIIGSAVKESAPPMACYLRPERLEDALDALGLHARSRCSQAAPTSIRPAWDSRSTMTCSTSPPSAGLRDIADER